MEQIDKTKELATKGIGQLLWQYALPTIISQIIASIYNIVDRIFLGQYVGSLAIAGLAITFPVMNVVHAFGSLVGAGSGARMSIVLGRRDIRWAEKILGNSVLLTFIFGFFFVAGTYIFMNPILHAFGASNDTIAFAREYMIIVMPGMFLTTLTFNLCGLIRATGYPTKSMWIMVVGALMNIILDALFIVVFKWGIAGAAWATTIAMACSSILAIWHFIPKSKNPAFIRFKKHCWKPKTYIFKNILAIGISPFSMNLAASGVAVIINYQLIKYGGDLAVGTYGIINSACLIIILLLLGICQGMQPIAGYNYGAKRSDRLKEIYILTLKVCAFVGVIGTLICGFFPQAILRCFTNENDLINMGVPALRYLTVMMPLIAFTITNSQFFQSIDKPIIAIVTSLSRQVIFLIPLMYIIPILFENAGNNGLIGVWFGCTISDVLGAVLAGALLYRQRKVFTGEYNFDKDKKRKKEYGPE